VQLNAAKVFVSPSVGYYPVIWADCQQASVHHAVDVHSQQDTVADFIAGPPSAQVSTVQELLDLAASDCTAAAIGPQQIPAELLLLRPDRCWRGCIGLSGYHGGTIRPRVEGLDWSWLCERHYRTFHGFYARLRNHAMVPIRDVDLITDLEPFSVSAVGQALFKSLRSSPAQPVAIEQSDRHHHRDRAEDDGEQQRRPINAENVDLCWNGQKIGHLATSGGAAPRPKSKPVLRNRVSSHRGQSKLLATRA
jgi:hypothetical protein